MRKLYEALNLLLPSSVSIKLTYAELMLELGDVDAAWELARGLEHANTGTLNQGVYLWAALAARHPEAVVALTDDIGKSADFDATLALAIALAVEGRYADDAAALDRASTLPLASAWPSVAMARFTEHLEGPVAAGLRRFAAQVDVAQQVNDDASYHAAMAALAAE